MTNIIISPIFQMSKMRPAKYHMAIDKFWVHVCLTPVLTPRLYTFFSNWESSWHHRLCSQTHQWQHDSPPSFLSQRKATSLSASLIPSLMDYCLPLPYLLRSFQFSYPLLCDFNLLLTTSISPQPKNRPKVKSSAGCSAQIFLNVSWRLKRDLSRTELSRWCSPPPSRLCLPQTCSTFVHSSTNKNILNLNIFSHKQKFT